LISIFVDDDEGPALTNARSRPGMAGGGRLIRGSAGDLLFFLLAEMTQARQRLLWRRNPMWLSSTSFYAGVIGVNTRGAKNIFWRRNSESQ
jgi:hypothetical protein